MSVSPIDRRKRVIDLDVFRGFAVLGIFMVNILVMNASFTFRGEWEAEQSGWLQKASFFFLETFFYSKFFVIFSFLFGMGVALQIQKAKEKNTFSNLFFIRRFGSLFLFGAMHILFIWSGDILHLYGALGFLLLPVFRFSARILLWLAITVFIFPFYGEIFEFVVNSMSFDFHKPLAELSRESIIELKQNGSYWSGVELRLKEYSFAMDFLYSGIGPVAFSMMLFGGYLVKRNILFNIPEWLNKSRLTLFTSLIIFTTYRFVLLYCVLPNFEIDHGSFLSFVLMSIFYLSDITLSLTYLWIIAYLLRSSTFKQVLSPLQYVGRTAFSNYIIQSTIGYVIMRTFGYYQSFSAFECILVVLSIFSFQVVISKIYLTYFRFGPLEWLWRCISYWKLLPLKK